MTKRTDNANLRALLQQTRTSTTTYFADKWLETFGVIISTRGNIVCVAALESKLKGGGYRQTENWSVICETRQWSPHSWTHWEEHCCQWTVLEFIGAVALTLTSCLEQVQLNQNLQGFETHLRAKQDLVCVTVWPPSVVCGGQTDIILDASLFEIDLCKYTTPYSAPGPLRSGNQMLLSHVQAVL